MPAKKVLANIPFADMLRVTTLTDPNATTVAAALTTSSQQQVDAIVALLQGRMADFTTLTAPDYQAPPTDKSTDSPMPKQEGAAASEVTEASEPMPAAIGGLRPSFDLATPPDAAPEADSWSSTSPEVAAPTSTTATSPIPVSATAPPEVPVTPAEPAPPVSTIGEEQPTPEEDWDALLASAAEEKWLKRRTVNPKDFLSSLKPEHLAPFAWGTTKGKFGPVTVELETAEDGSKSVFLFWEPVEIADKPAVVYRVVGADTEQARSPETGTTLVFTKGTAFREKLDPKAGMRHYMVWAYAAATVKEIINVQPVLVGEQPVALPPTDFSVVETNGIVTGTWTPLKGHSNVAVYARQRGVEEPLDSPIHLLRTGVDARSFSFTAPIRGASYEFQIFPEITFGGHTMRGEGSQIECRTISADIQAVELLTAVALEEDNKDLIILTWIAPPTGEVKIYLTQSEPAPDLIGKAVDSSYLLDDDALGSTEWVSTIESDPGDDVAKDLIWPANWPQVFCVPVNVVGEKSLVGEYKVLQKVAPITDYSLIQRVDSQLITFDWPTGAQLVEVTQRQGETKELTEADYRRQGGIRLHLNDFGDEVTLTPKSIYAGVTTRADATTINYPGLKVYSYKIDGPELDRTYALLWIWRRGTEDRHPPQFILVHNPERFPLYSHDGQAVELAEAKEHGYARPGPVILPEFLPSSQQEARRQGKCWAVNSSGLHGGYLRLFMQPDHRDAENPGSRIVVDDDTIVDLKVGV